jgi:hypothetical protein
VAGAQTTNKPMAPQQGKEIQYSPKTLWPKDDPNIQTQEQYQSLVYNQV